MMDGEGPPAKKRRSARMKGVRRPDYIDNSYNFTSLEVADTSDSSLDAFEHPVSRANNKRGRARYVVEHDEDNERIMPDILPSFQPQGDNGDEPAVSDTFDPKTHTTQQPAMPELNPDKLIELKFRSRRITTTTRIIFPIPLQVVNEIEQYKSQLIQRSLSGGNVTEISDPVLRDYSDMFHVIQYLTTSYLPPLTTAEAWELRNRLGLFMLSCELGIPRLEGAIVEQISSGLEDVEVGALVTFAKGCYEQGVDEAGSLGVVIKKKLVGLSQELVQSGEVMGIMAAGEPLAIQVGEILIQRIGALQGGR